MRFVTLVGLEDVSQILYIVHKKSKQNTYKSFKYVGVGGITDKLPEISRSASESIALVGLSTKWLLLCDRHLPWQGRVHPRIPSNAESHVWAQGRHGALLPQAAGAEQGRGQGELPPSKGDSSHTSHLHSWGYQRAEMWCKIYLFSNIVNIVFKAYC